MEIAKFIFTALGTFVAVSGLSLNLLNAWMKKKQEEIAAERALNKTAWDTIQGRVTSEQAHRQKEIDEERASRRDAIDRERASRKEEQAKLEQRIERLEKTVSEQLLSRVSAIETELKNLTLIMGKLQDYFVFGSGGKQ